MKRWQRITIIVLILLILILFFWPKECGSWKVVEKRYEKSCDCFGFKHDGWAVGGGKTYCLGYCLRDSCGNVFEQVKKS